MDPFTAIIGSAIGGLISGGASYLGGQQANSANQALNASQMLFNAQASANQNAFNAQEAQKSRDFSFGALQNTEQFNQNSAQTQMSFQNAEMDKAMAFNAQQAQAQRDYETQMSNTAYQRAVSSMKAAGLNPILSAGTGGASTPTGSSASISAPSGASASVGNPPSAMASGSQASISPTRMQDVLSPAVSNALQGAKLSEELRGLHFSADAASQQYDRVGSETDLNNQNTLNAIEQKKNIQMQRGLIQQQIADTAASARQKDASTANTQAQTDQITKYGTGNVIPGVSPSAVVRSGYTAGNTIWNWGKAGYDWLLPQSNSMTPSNPAPPAPAPPVVPASPVGRQDGIIRDGGHGYNMNNDGTRGVMLW